MHSFLNFFENATRKTQPWRTATRQRYVKMHRQRDPVCRFTVKTHAKKDADQESARKHEGFVRKRASEAEN